jgi:hypothetical protein
MGCEPLGEAMRRRDFITLLGGVAVGWPLAARAQQSERRIGALMSTAADEPEGQARLAAFRDGLRQLGWTERPQRADRYSLACERARQLSQIRRRTSCAGTGRYPGL